MPVRGIQTRVMTHDTVSCHNWSGICRLNTTKWHATNWHVCHNTTRSGIVKWQHFTSFGIVKWQHFTSFGIVKWQHHFVPLRGILMTQMLPLQMLPLQMLPLQMLPLHFICVMRIQRSGIQTIESHGTYASSWHIECRDTSLMIHMGWLHVVGSLKWRVSFAKEPYNRDGIQTIESHGTHAPVWRIDTSFMTQVSWHIIGLFCWISSLL